MPDLQFKQPCNDCPFRRNSLAGWLGAGTPESFVNGALADYIVHPLPCHQTIDYGDPNWQETQYPDSALCTGALIFCKNNMKSPRDPERSKLVRSVEEDENVFQWPHEFIEHHRSGVFRSWEED